MSSGRPQRRPHPLGLLHRHGGIIAAVLVIIICITGIMLNHTDELELAQQPVKNSWLLNWYGIATPETESFAAGKDFISHSGDRLFFNATPIPGRYSQPAGAISAGSTHVVALANKLLIISTSGELIEELQDYHGVPGNIQQIGTQSAQVYLLTTAGLWRAEADLLSWQPSTEPGDNIQWATAAPLPADLEASISASQVGAGLPLERVILDIHSGQILGKAGPWLGDAVAVLFIVLALSGIWMWFRARNRAR